MNKKKLTWYEKYLFDEIGIEFKACLYFFAILFFYCIYRICCREYDALSFLDRHLEVARNIEVLCRCVSPLLLLRIFNPAVPVWLEYELVLLAELHV